MSKGDFVLSFVNCEGIIQVGKAMEDQNSDGEFDLEFFDGGSVSPGNGEENYVISEQLARLINALIDAVPTDDEGMFIFKEKANEETENTSK